MEPSDYGPFDYSPINRRKPWHWPNGSRLALWLIPNIEFFPLTRPLPGHPWEKASGNAADAPTVRAWGQRDYGNRIGIFRIMDVLDKHGIRATATINSDICDQHPQIVEDAVRLGWEFMGHNKTNSQRLTGLDLEAERQVIRDALERIRQATGKKPVGWLGSGLAETWNTLDLLADEGCLYVSDWVNDDQPYRMQAGGGEIIYLPYSYETNDNAQIVSRFASIDDFERMIKRTFDVLYQESEESARVMAICLHPFISGVPHRIAGLDAAFRYICDHHDVWWATGQEIVDAYLASGAEL
jgi:peptidoglycan/xylan/chitin deacetylase (PgdA/CDA1 family)